MRRTSYFSLLSLFRSLAISMLFLSRLMSQAVPESPSCHIPSISAPAAGAPGVEQLSLSFCPSTELLVSSSNIRGSPLPKQRR